MNYKLMQRQLDLAASELDKKGYRDLSDKVDRYNVRIKTASPSQRTVIAQALRAIEQEMDRRDGVTTAPTQADANKAAAIRRKLAIRQRIEKHRARINAAKDDSDLRVTRQQRLASRRL